MRPAGEIRQALRSVAPVPQPGAQVVGASYLQLAREVAPQLGLNPAAPAELRLVRKTVKNMVQAGELTRVGSAKPSKGRRALGLYAAAGAWDAQAATRADAGAALQSVWRAAAWGQAA